MANPSFLQSPFQTLINQKPEPLPGSDPTKDLPVVEMQEAPAIEAPPAPMEAPVAAQPVRKKVGKVSLAPPPELRQAFEVSAQHFGVPANILMAIAQQESSYDNNAVNKESGAAGIGGYMDATAKALKINARDPNEAIPAIAMQLSERLKKGVSMEDAIREHFAGPNRKLWGEKTAAYGPEVLAKAEQIASELYGEDGTPAPQSAKQNAFAPDRMARAEYEAEFKAMNPKATPGAIDAVMAQYDEQAKARTKAKGNAVQDKFAQMQSPEAMFDARLSAKLQAKNQGVAQVLPSRQQPVDVNPQAQASRERPGVLDQASSDFGRGIDNLKALGYGIGGLAADATGNDEAADRMLGEYVAIQNDIAANNPATIGTYKNVKSLGDAGRYAIEAVAENLPMFLPSLISGGVGAQVAKKGAERVVAGMIESQVAKGVAREVAEKQAAQFITRRVLQGSVAGAVPASVGMEAGSIMGDIYQETGGKRSGLALAAGIPAGLLDAVQPVVALRKIAGPVVDEVAGGLLKRMGKEAGLQFLTEAGTEGLQTVIEEFAAAKAANRSMPTDHIIDAMLKGGIGGGVMGVASQGINEARGAMARPEAGAAPNPQPQNRVEPVMGEPAAPVEDAPFASPIMGDDGQMKTIDFERGVIEPEAPSAPSGPLESALLQAAEQHAADPAPAPILPSAEPAAPDYTAMGLEDLRARMKEIAGQAKQATDPEQRKQIAAERKTVEQEIAARGKQAVADSKPAEEPLSSGPFEDIKSANKMMMRYATETGAPHEVVGSEGAFKIQPLKEQGDGNERSDTAGAGGRPDGLGRSGADAAGLGNGNGVRPEGTGPAPGSAGGDAGQRVRNVQPDPAAATDATDTAAPVARDPGDKRPQENPYRTNQFASFEKADAFMTKKAIDRDAFEVAQTGPKRWQVIPTLPKSTPKEVVADVPQRQEVPEEAPIAGGAKGKKQADAVGGKAAGSGEAAASAAPAVAHPELAAQGERAAMDGYMMSPPGVIRKKAERESWEQGWMAGKAKRDALTNGKEAVAVEDRRAVPVVKSGKVVWRDEAAGKDYDSPDAARAGLEAKVAAEREFDASLEQKPKRQPSRREVTNAKQEEVVRKAQEAYDARKAAKEKDVYEANPGWENDPEVIEYQRLAQRVQDAEKWSDPNDWTEDQRAAYRSEDWKKFSRLRGYTPDEIEEFDKSTALAEKLDKKYGDGFSAGITPESKMPAVPVRTDEHLYQQAVATVKEYKRPSASLIQRTFKISYAKADELLDRMQAEGLIAKDSEGARVMAAPAKSKRKPAAKSEQAEPWRTSLMKARAKAKELGISTKDKSIYALVEQIDATLNDTIDNIDTARIRATMADPAANSAILEGIADNIEAQTGKRPEWNPTEKEAEGVRYSVSGDVTDSPAFKAWFKNSKVVDANGKPLVVYHGTAQDFSEFQADRAGQNFDGKWDWGLFFTNNNVHKATGKMDPEMGQKVLHDVASTTYFAKAASAGRAGADKGGVAYVGANVMPVYVSMQNPLVIEKTGNLTAVEYFDKNSVVLRKKLDKGGHDGVIIKDAVNDIDGAPETLVVALRPEQIKSAVGNNGEFSPDNPDIRYSVDDYRDEHRAPGREDGAPLHDLTGEGTIYPDDVYSANGPRYYGTGVKYDADAFRIAKMAKGKPDFDVMIFRAVPSDVDADINPGDWVAITRQYAVDHGESRFDGNYKILTKMVKASEIFTNGDSIQEWGYDPEQTKYSARDEIAFSTAAEISPLIQKLADGGVVVVHADASTLPGGKAPDGVQALTEADGTIHLVASSLTDANARAVLLHEAFHAGGKNLIGSEQWNALLKRLGALYRQGEQSSGKARAFWDRARSRVASAKAKGAVADGMEHEEFGAYAIEEYESAPPTIRKWVDDLVGMVKAWMLRRFGRQLGQVSPAQLSALAKLALLDVRASREQQAYSVDRRNHSIQVEGQRRPIENSKGQIIAEDMNKQLAFYRWFKSSKVVDEQQRPLVVYHGTPRSFSEFSENEDGIFFSQDPSYAQDYAGTDDGANLMPAYLSMQNPYEITGAELDAGEGLSISEAREAGHDGYIVDYEGSKDFAVFDPKQVKSAVGNNGQFDPANADIRYSVAGDPQPRELTPPEQGLLRRVQANIQDGQNRIKQVIEQIQKVTGVRDLGAADHYMAETNRPGRIAARKEDARDRLFAPMMKRLSKAGYTMEQLSELLHAQHAAERNEAVARINPEFADGGSGMKTADAEAVLERYKNEGALLRLADEARNVARSTLDLKLAYGLITRDQYDTLAVAYENYVPLKGDGEYGPKVKRAMGHDERAEHILENIARDYEQAIVVGEKNLARQSLLQMVLQFADDALWTARVPPRGRYVAGTVFNIKHKGTDDIVAGYTSQAQVQAWLEAQGAAASQYEVNTSAGEQVVEFTRPLQDNEVMVYVKGDPVRVQIYDEALARQLRPLKSEQMNVVLSAMRNHNRYLSMIFTGYNPSFIIKNATRDAITGTINMTGNHGMVTAAKAWWRYRRAWTTMLQWATTKKTPDTEMGRMLDEYRSQGGKVGASYMSDLEEQGKSLQRMFDDVKGVTGYAAEGRVGKAAWIAARKAIGGLAHVIEVLNQAFENALRLALFAELRAQGKKPGVAAAAAKAVTVNFDRKGTMTPQLGAFYLFINPAIQGTANMSRTLTKGEHKMQAWALTGMVAAAGYAAAAMGMDDDKDRWLGEKWDVRTKNFRLRVGETTINIPMSQEYAPFYAFGVAMGEVSRGESSIRAAARTLSSFLDAYYPMNGAFDLDSDQPGMDLILAHVPTVARVPAQIGLNRNGRGGEVVPESDSTKNRPDNLKMYRGTKNSVYDALAQKIATEGYSNDLSKVSPETFKLIYSTYTGGLGRFIADTAGLGKMATDAEIELGANDWPILREFVKDDTVAPIRNRFRDLSAEARKTIDEFGAAKKARDAKAMRAIVDDEDRRSHLALAKMVKKIGEVQSIYADRAVDINADKSLSPADKRAQLKELEDEQEAIYRKAIAAFSR